MDTPSIAASTIQPQLFRQDAGEVLGQLKALQSLVDEAHENLAFQVEDDDDDDGSLFDDVS